MNRKAAKKLIPLFSIIALILASLSCTIDLNSKDDTLNQTQTAIASQQTALANQSGGVNATITAQQATIDAAAAAQATAMAGQQEPPPDLAATQMALAVAETAAAMQTEPVMMETPLSTEPPPPPADLEARMKTASILVYEDIVVDPTETQYVKKTLDSMGLRYKWDGNAVGWLKSDMLAGGPNGQPWDLVILAIEARGDVSGEYFEYLNDVLNQGTSVILEAWHLDDISEGAISPILAKCGVMVYPYVPKTGTVNDVVIWSISGVRHPVLLEPNSGMTFTKARDTWLWSFDLGSQMALTGQGDAVLLLGTNATEPYQDGVLAVCMGGQLILQTFSSHSFPYQVMYPLWENYIYNALKVRFSGGG
jgi:hypothetical protein